MSWHLKTQTEIFKELKTGIKGLSQNEALKRLEENGKNELKQNKKELFIIKLLKSLAERMNIILLIAAAISFIVSKINNENAIDTFIILAIVTVNGIVNVIQENKAERALEALKKMSTPMTGVMRDGKKNIINSSELVVGDIIILEKGSFIPADARIIESNSLVTDESALTGEPLGIYKTAEALEYTGDTNIALQKNMVWSGTSIIGGKGIAVVVACGMDSYIGSIAKMITTHESNKTPLQKRLAKTSTSLGNVALFVCFFIFVYSIIKGFNMSEMFLTAVSLAVAAIPEGLPAIVTIMLSIGVTKMAKRRALVKKLPAVETLGCATVICSDKTGTLTQNKMTVTKTIGDKKSLSMLFMLNNDNSSPTELALTNFSEKHTDADIVKQYPRIAEIPFDSKLKLMATLHKMDKKYLAVIKGAPDIVSKYFTNYDEKADREVRNMAAEALRVIAVGSVVLNKIPNNLLDVKYEFCGLAGMFDPPREEAAEAVDLCKKAGIKPIMITGDHLDTAIATAKKLNMFKDGDYAYTQHELEKMTDNERKRAILKCKVFARTTPEFKLKIVEEHQKNGEVVAMTGDGVNDAPALKKADIGCSMGICGTEVAKEASDIVLTDDNFATIVGAVSYGRSIYANIKRAVHFLISCNIGEIITVFIAIAAALPSPLAAIQLLWVNLVTDSLPAIALGMEKPTEDLMKRKPIKSNKGLFNFSDKVMIFAEGVLISLLSLAAYLIGARTYDHITGRTMCFAVLSISQLVHCFNVRSEKSIFKTKLFSNPFLIFSFILSLSLQICVIIIPQVSGLFGVTSLNFTCWKIVAVL
ncbi:cation-translocating P-type ATPase, partial [Eubacteriales bacterium OttesenSCG-928-G02]|nr:cation-translocating P-type ATPase [Eubacteriales bacterium OttesenSCG-928-G02]